LSAKNNWRVSADRQMPDSGNGDNSTIGANTSSLTGMLKSQGNWNQKVGQRAMK